MNLGKSQSLLNVFFFFYSRNVPAPNPKTMFPNGVVLLKKRRFVRLFFSFFTNHLIDGIEREHAVFPTDEREERKKI